MNESVKGSLTQPLNSPPEAINPDALPSAIETNSPQKKEKSKHLLELFATLYFLASIGFGVYNYVKTQNPNTNTLYWTLGQGYAVYLILVMYCNKTRKYLSNIQRSTEYERIYYSVTQASGHFVFHVECYHYETRVTYHTMTDKDGNTYTEARTTQERVVTHTATENITPVDCKDESGHIEEIIEKKSVIFLKYESRYLFVDQRSENLLHSSFENFKRYNNRDVHQDSSFKFIIPGMVERLAFFTHKPITTEYFYIFGILGMAFPYCLWLESTISRYTIQITKRLTM